MRQFCEKNNFPYPAYALCYNISEAEHFFLQAEQSIIIKPLDSNSSRGVFKISSVGELHKYFDESLSFSKTEKAVLAERYINGTEFTIDGIKTKDKHYSLAVSKKYHYKHNINIANQLFFSYQDDEYDYDKLRKINDTLIEKTDLPDGCLTHSEYKFENGEFYLIETAARGGGNLISSDIVPLLSGIDNYQYLINFSLGILNESKIKIDECLKRRCAVLYFFDTPNVSGIVKSIEGLDYLQNSKNIISYKLNFNVGDEICKAVNDAARIGFYIAYAETKQNLLDVMNNVNKYFKIVCL
jgi:biotin carboxylase